MIAFSLSLERKILRKTLNPINKSTKKPIITIPNFRGFFIAYPPSSIEDKEMIPRVLFVCQWTGAEALKN
jgi:hypothetical protein